MLNKKFSLMRRKWAMLVSVIAIMENGRRAYFK